VKQKPGIVKLVCVLGAMLVAYVLVVYFWGYGGTLILCASLDTMSKFESLHENGKVIPGKVLSKDAVPSFGRWKLYGYVVSYRGYTEPQSVRRAQNRTAADDMVEGLMDKDSLWYDFVIGEDGLPRQRAHFDGKAGVTKEAYERLLWDQPVAITVGADDDSLHTVGLVNETRLEMEWRHHTRHFVKAGLMLVGAAVATAGVLLVLYMLWKTAHSFK
jgi:hypothetical protein